MPVHDDLGVRMKTFYEQIPKTKLMRRCPVAIRIDGKAFHTFTRGFQKPFDEILIKSMQETMKYLCENIQGCVLGYAQSDEVTLILVDYKKLTSAAWFDYEIQKCCSIAASMATMAFNNIFSKYVKEFDLELAYNDNGIDTEENRKLWEIYKKALNKGAMFDARCFNIPKEEVTNLVYWRQLDAMRNSIQMLGQANFSHRELQNKTCKDIKEMLVEQKGINWDELPIYQKRGSCCIKETEVCQIDGGPGIERSHWVVDNEIPVFKDENRQYIDRFVYIGEE